jgi:hypothetical protein
VPDPQIGTFYRALLTAFRALSADFSPAMQRATSRVTARAATAEEHDRLWPLVTTTHPGYARYQERTARLIPIVMLTPENE